VKIRIAIGLGGVAMDPAEFTTVIQTMASLRFDSLWISEVLTGPGPDPLVALATAAQLNPRLKLGTTIVLPGRNDARLAKALASLDVMTGGRLLITFVPGLAHGPERDAIGVPVKDRGTAIETTLPKLRRWWAGEIVDDITIRPRPQQDPLEIWLAGLAPASLRRCGQLADGWLGAACSAAEARQARVAIQQAAVDAGRTIDPEHFGMSIGYATKPLDEQQQASLAARVRTRDVDPRTLVPVGKAELRTALADFIDAGISKFVLRPINLEVPWHEELAALAAAVGDLQT
jgi:probable F420-dependent oxidoreductase